MGRGAARRRGRVRRRVQRRTCSTCRPRRAASARPVRSGCWPPRAGTPARCRPPARSPRQCSGTCGWSAGRACAGRRAVRRGRPACSACPTTSRPAGAPLPPSPRRLRRCSPPATSPGPDRAAFKNVVAIAVGLAEGLSERLGESALAANFANARAAVAPAACSTCWRSRRRRAAGWRPCSGWPGAGDLYVTGQHGRNGRFGGCWLGRHRRRRDPLDRQHRGGSSEHAAALAARRRGPPRPPLRTGRRSRADPGLTGERVSDQLRELFRTVVTGSKSSSDPQPASLTRRDRVPTAQSPGRQPERTVAKEAHRPAAGGQARVRRCGSCQTPARQWRHRVRFPAADRGGRPDLAVEWSGPSSRWRLPRAAATTYCRDKRRTCGHERARALVA